VLRAFDLLEVDGEGLRRLPIELRKAGLARLLPKPLQGIAANEYFAGDACGRRMSFQASDRSHPGRTIPSAYILPPRSRTKIRRVRFRLLSKHTEAIFTLVVEGMLLVENK